MMARLRTIIHMNELVFEVTQEEDGGGAECLSENIFTQGDTWEAVRRNVQEAVRGYYFDQPQCPRRIRLHLCGMGFWPTHESASRFKRRTLDQITLPRLGISAGASGGQPCGFAG